MKYILALFILTIFSDLAFGQEKHHNKIDEISSLKEAQQLIRKVTQDTSIIVNINLKFNSSYKKLEQFADSLNAQPLYKSDFDNNGWTDLLVTTKHTNSEFAKSYVICIMDSGENKFSYKYIYEYSFSLVTSIDSSKLILNYHQKNTYVDFVQSSEIKIDTLIFKYGAFIEFNKTPACYSIQKIEFRSNGGYWGGPVYTISIGLYKNSTYTPIYYYFANKKGEDEKKIKMKYHAIIDNKHYEEIIDLLNYIDFKNLNNDYETGWSDLQSCDLIITYNNGQVKSIHDYGLMGSFGLRCLYSKFSQLTTNQSWER